MKHLLIVSLALSLATCSKNASNVNNSSTVNPSQSINPDKAAKDKEFEELQAKEKAEEDKALNDFLLKNYPGWKLEGVADNVFYGALGRDLHIVNGSKSKVVPVIVKAFFLPDGTSYTIAHEIRPIDMSSAKRLQWEQVVKEDLTTEDCQSLIDRYIEDNASLIVSEHYNEVAQPLDEQPERPF